ncbi:MAG: ATP-binding protein [Pseudomonadales bacterium]
MKVFSKLYSKLALAMLLLFMLLGIVLVYISNRTSELYSLEITQRINRDIAQHAAEDMPLFTNGEVNVKALKELAHHVMFINPIVEVYLLDVDGKVLSHALPYETVVLDRVNMAPLRAFMNKQQALPIFGDDPRSPGQQKVFSVSPIVDDGQVAAYLYTVLNGISHDGLRQTLKDSYNLQAGTVTIIASILLAIVAGLLIFALLTKRLHRLISAVRVYRDGSFQGRMTIKGRSSAGDEIDELSHVIGSMSERIEDQFAALQQVDNTRRELIANVSHDLRTPLASMQGYLETVLVKAEELNEDDQKLYLQTAYKHSRRLNDLIGELFELSKLESANVEPEWEEFPLMELIQDLVQDYELEASDRQISLSAHCEDMAITVYADIALIHRVLENLLQNALRHTSAGGDIALNVRGDEQKVWIEVVDDGEGIAEHEIPHIFDRFYRPETDPSQAGHGLGLAIVKRILELHRSQVAVRSEIDHGTAFTFWLPHTA